MAIGRADGAEVIGIAIEQLCCFAGAEHPALKNRVKAADKISVKWVWPPGGVVVVVAAEFVCVYRFLLGLAEQAGVEQPPVHCWT